MVQIEVLMASVDSMLFIFWFHAAFTHCMPLIEVQMVSVDLILFSRWSDGFMLDGFTHVFLHTNHWCEFHFS